MINALDAPVEAAYLELEQAEDAAAAIPARVPLDTLAPDMVRLDGLIHLGMDTSKNTIVVATLLAGEESPFTDRVVNEEAAIRRLVGRFGDRSVLRCWYEAGPGGYELFRLLASMGWRARWWRRR